ncbi:MAG TPA: hypothetical protein VHP58_00360 [Alphaproteobacteria bacterium]|nr:hypothetical protein [Alphaproteobacteria bacterium]
MRILHAFMLATALSLSLAAPAHAQLDDSALPTAQAGHQAALPFTTFAAETQAATEKLYCKWKSLDGRDGGGRYDFLCVGGNWATVHLMLDKSHKVGGGLARVRLIWREWPASHPAAAENVVAADFLKYAADRFISPKLAPEVMQSFWGARERSWQNNDSRITYQLTDNDTHRIHRLEIVGLATSLKLPNTPPPAESHRIEWPQSRAPEVIKMAPVVEPARQTPQAPEPRAEQPQIPANAPVKLPEQPAPQPAKPAPSVSEPAALQPATPADIAPQPDPESLKKPVAAPTPSSTLIPSSASSPNASAPSNFDSYNRAQQLTRDVQEKAFGKVAPPKAVPAVAPATPGSNSGGLLQAPPAQPAPPVIAVPTPGVVSGSVPSPTTPGVAEGEGLGSPSATPELTPAQKAAQKAGAAVGAPSTVAPWDQPTPRGAARPLPQLKFVPKAQPIDNPAETIQFEDEKSKL